MLRYTYIACLASQWNYNFACFCNRCETWSVTLRGYLRVGFRGGYFRPKRDEERGDWRIAQQKALCCVLLTTYYSGRTYDTYGEQERCLLGFDADTWGKETT